MEGVGFIPQLSEPIDETFQQVAEEVAVAAAEQVRAAGMEAETTVQQGQAG